MCYNCGCKMPNNDMGKAENITNQKFDEAAKAMGMTPEESLKNARELLELVLASPQQSKDTNWKPPGA